MAHAYLRYGGVKKKLLQIMQCWTPDA